MARVTPEQAAAKWQTRLSGATQEIAAGVQRVQTAPGQAAAQRAAEWLARVQASRDKWVRNVSRVSLQDWQNAMLQVGVPRVAQGAQAHQGKVTAFMNEFLPHLDRGVAQVRAMPKMTLEDGIARATAMIRHNANFRRSGGVNTGTGR